MWNSSRPVIVVGASGSPASRRALRWAADEAMRRGARLVIVRAWLPARAAFYAGHADQHDAEHERQAAAWELASTLRATFGGKLPPGAFTEVTEGMAERILVEKSAGADMLVLGSTSSPTVVGRAIGPVIRSCLSRAHCPVVVIGPEGQRADHGTDRQSAGAAGTGHRAAVRC
jgi:nucleotide-binding universal stress UspA family protein